MNISKFKHIITIALVIVFVSLFYQNLLGLNVLVFELLSVGLIYILYNPSLKSLTSKVLFFGTFITAFMLVFHNSSIAKVVNIFSFLLLIGSLASPSFTLFKSLVYQFVFNIRNGIFQFKNSLTKRHGIRLNLFYYFKIIVIPIFLIIFFLIIYYNSNARFAHIFDNLGKTIEKVFNWIPNFNVIMFLYIVLGFIISVAAIYAVRSNRIIEQEMNKNDTLFRRKNNTYSSTMGLKNEIKSGLFLLSVLNFLLLIFNFSDISTIWFNFKWDGGFLKEFVHQGTYFLIVSLLVSIVIVLYFFRNNINFYSKNKSLKVLTYLWLVQNFVLIISLFIRNTIYINHFALAYKRIGVYAFLMAATYGLYSVFVKVKQRKTFYYLVKKNSLVIYGVFVLLTCVSWDVFITQYNLKAYKKAYIETNFLMYMSDKALPYIDLDSSQLAKIDKIQKKNFSFHGSRSSKYTQNYTKKIENRRKEFIKKYAKRNIWEWNYAEYKAYSLLNE